MQSQLRDVGIDLRVQKMERGPYLDYVRAYKHNMAATASTSVDPDGVLRIVYHSSGRGSGSNFANVNDPGLDALLIKGQGPVSYTHLRAHETPEHLVCRL